ncbi:MAG TPA: hypothetical protein VE987_09550 [Polyangiaceae bacterium]|nr:hypothetical protein [Polyangiaceae bacterium]
MTRCPSVLVGLIGGLSLGLPACDDVPTLTFGPDDGAASVADASPDKSNAPDATCSAQPPAGASACCGSVWCVGDCEARCSDCQSRCSNSGSICCAISGASCHPAGFVCH